MFFERCFAIYLPLSNHCASDWEWAFMAYFLGSTTEFYSQLHSPLCPKRLLQISNGTLFCPIIKTETVSSLRLGNQGSEEGDAFPEPGKTKCPGAAKDPGPQQRKEGNRRSGDRKRDATRIKISVISDTSQGPLGTDKAFCKKTMLFGTLFVLRFNPA
jgi:hypothetical protein